MRVGERKGEKVFALIRTESEYQAVLREVALLMESDPTIGTPDADRLDALAALIEAYEHDGSASSAGTRLDGPGTGT